MRTALIRAREAKDLSRTDLGDLVGVSDEAVRLWERGERSPEPEIAVKVAVILERSPVELWPDLAAKIVANAKLFFGPQALSA